VITVINSYSASPTGRVLHYASTIKDARTWCDQRLYRIRTNHRQTLDNLSLGVVDVFDARNSHNYYGPGF
jgi:hypothetical protein